jgi:hypothetical protein
MTKPKEEWKTKKTLAMDVLDEELHYDWGASAAKQWRTCKGSVAFINEAKADKLIPKETTSVYAEEGVKAHSYADNYLKGEITRDDIPTEFLEHLEGYIQLAEEIALTKGNHGYVFTEQRIPYFYNDTEYGTVDFAVATEEKVTILDLKYGVGEKVDAFENSQMSIYALSLMKYLSRKFNIRFTMNTVISMNIYQPRHRSFDGIAETWEVSYFDLCKYGAEIEADYKESKLAKSSDLNPSYDACRFCDARRICIARVAKMFDGIPDELNPIKNNVTTESIKEMKKNMMEITDAVRVRVAAVGKEIAKYFEELNEDSLERIEQGAKIDGLKTIDGGKGNRKWGNNEPQADKLLRNIPAADRYAPKKLLSPAQIEKVLAKTGVPVDKQSARFITRWKELVQQPDGAPKLALASDPKPARVVAIDSFEDELDEGDCI